MKDLNNKFKVIGYAECRGDDNVSVINAKSLKVTGTINTGEGCRAFGQFIVK